MKKLTDNQIAELIRKASDSLKLSASDKGILKAELIDVIKSGSTRINKGSKIRNIINPRRLAMPLIPMIIAILIALGGGTAALADSANPGDFLYPVDQWVEGIQGRFMRSDEAKAVWQARLGEERLKEYRVLHGINPADMTDKQVALLEQHRQEATERLQNRLKGIRNAQEQLEAKLEVATDDVVYQGVEKALGRLEEIEARQETRIAEIEEGIEFPKLDPEIKRRFEEMRREHQKRMEQIQEQIREHMDEWVEGLDPYAPPINPIPEPQPLVPDEIVSDNGNNTDDTVVHTNDEPADDDDGNGFGFGEMFKNLL